MSQARITLIGVLGILAAVPFVSNPVAATGAMVGVADITVPGCAPDVTEFHAQNVPSDIWRFDIGFGCTAPKLIFTGAWDPAAGGCVPGVSVSGQWCVGAAALGPGSVSVTLCIGFAPTWSCQTGSATFVRA